MPLPLAAVFQPVKYEFVWVMLPVWKSVSAVGVFADSLGRDPCPPLLLKVTVNVPLAAHCAYSVVLAVNGYVAPSA